MAITHLSALRTNQMGKIALDGLNPTSVTFPDFTALEGAVLTLQNGVAPGLGTSVLTYTISGNTLNIFAWKPTSLTDPTLIASTGIETVSYLVWGS